MDIRPYGIAGASVGDSQAWMIDEGEIVSLTAEQNRKPLLGSGQAIPVGFNQPPLHGILVAGTDGFFDYAKRDDIIRLYPRAISTKFLASSLIWYACHQVLFGTTSESSLPERSLHIAPARSTKSSCSHMWPFPAGHCL